MERWKGNKQEMMARYTANDPEKEDDDNDTSKQQQHKKKEKTTKQKQPDGDPAGGTENKNGPQIK